MSSVMDHFAVDEFSLAEVPHERLWRFSVEQYHEMIGAGILHDDDRVELIEGLLVRKMSKNPPHVFALDTLRDFLFRQALQKWVIRLQDPITLGKSEPEPDLVLARGTRRDYTERHPSPADVGLAVEVADSTLAEDRGYKKSVYAQSRIAQYWIVNLVDGQIEVYNDPTGRGSQADYRVQRVYKLGESVPLTLDDVEIVNVPVSELIA